MYELVVGAVLGALLGAGLGFDVRAVLLLALGCGVALYLGSCRLRPYSPCRWWWHKAKVEDKRGNYRLRTCWLCGGQPYRRFGARLIGAG